MLEPVDISLRRISTRAAEAVLLEKNRGHRTPVLGKAVISFFRNLPLKKLARPVGQDEAPADIISNLRLLGLWTPDVERDLDLCTRLSCVIFDVER